MIVGDPSIFAIESDITQAYERLSFLALGYFVIHVDGMRYGIPKPNATLLAGSFDEVNRRIGERGRHIAPFSADFGGWEIAQAFYGAIYGDAQEYSFLGMPAPEFRQLFSAQSNGCLWVPDGDEAFDDGTYILQFDMEDRVRLIAFKSREGFVLESSTLRDLWIAADHFYNILQRWSEGFRSEWATMPKLQT